MLSIVALDAAATAAGTELFFGIFSGRTTVIELEDVPLVLRDGGSEFGAEYPVGTKSISKYVGLDPASASANVGHWRWRVVVGFSIRVINSRG